jgi:hypothetical protein
MDKNLHPIASSSVAPQPKYEPWPLLGFFFLRRFSTNFFLQGEVVSLTPNPKPGGPGLRIYTPRDRVAQQYPRTLGTSGSPFPVPTYVGPWGKTEWITNSVAPEPEGSSPYSQEPATGPYPELLDHIYTPPTNLPKIHSVPILPSTLFLALEWHKVK